MRSSRGELDTCLATCVKPSCNGTRWRPPGQSGTVEWRFWPPKTAATPIRTEGAWPRPVLIGKVGHGLSLWFLAASIALVAGAMVDLAGASQRSDMEELTIRAGTSGGKKVLNIRPTLSPRLHARLSTSPPCTRPAGTGQDKTGIFACGSGCFVTSSPRIGQWAQRSTGHPLHSMFC